MTTQEAIGDEVRADDPAALTRVHAYAMVANMTIVALSYATGGLSADLVQLFAVQTLLLSPGAVGLALGALILSLPFQLVAPNLATRFGHRTLMRAGYAVVVVLLAAMAALPALQPYGHVLVFMAFALVILLIEITVSGSWGVAWHPWMRQITRAAQRPRFIARMQLTAQLFNLIVVGGFGLIAGAVVTAGEYGALLGLLSVCLVLSIVLMERIPDEPVAGRAPAAPAPRAPLLRPIVGALRVMRADSRLRALHLMALLDTLVMIPLLPAYSILYLGVPAGVVAAAIAVRSLAGALSGVRWARLVRERGPGTVIALTMGITALLRLGWLVVPHAATGHASGFSIAVFVVLMVLSGVLGTGYGNAALSTWYDVTPDDQSTGMFTLRDVLLSTKGQVAMAICGLMLAWLAGTRPIPGTGSYADGFKILLLVGAVAALVVVGLARRLGREPVEQ